MTENNNNFIYELDNKIYVNLTNACTNNCIFCIREQKDDVKGANMWLSKKPDFDEVVSQLENKKELLKNGVTFCGYGEPLLEYELLLKLSKYIKEKYPQTKIRINTNGHANCVLKKDVTVLLKDYIDEISISLNAADEKSYNKLCRPKIENAFNEVKKFAHNSIKSGIKTTLTVVTNYDDANVNVDECEKFAKSIGANFRKRAWIKDGY